MLFKIILLNGNFFMQPVFTEQYDRYYGKRGVGKRLTMSQIKLWLLGAHTKVADTTLHFDKD